MKLPRRLLVVAAATAVACTGLYSAALSPEPASAFVAAYESRTQVKAHIDALRQYVWKAVADSKSVPKPDYAVIKARGDYLLALLKRQVTALSAAVGASEVDAVGRKVDAIEVLAKRFVTAAAQVRQALTDMASAAAKGQATLSGALTSHTTATATYRAKQSAWANAGTWAAQDRSAALAAIPKGIAAPARTYPAAAAKATAGGTVTPSSGRTGVPGGCALVSAPVTTWLGTAVRPRLRAWTGSAQVADYRARVEQARTQDPTGDLYSAYTNMLRRINEGRYTDQHPADANEAMDVVGKLGFQALADLNAQKQSVAKDALVRVAGELLRPGPDAPGWFDGTFYMWTAASALNWAQPGGTTDTELSELLWVRWMGRYSCMLARGDSMVRGTNNITVVTTTAIAMTALIDASSRPAIAAAVLKRAVAGDLPGLQALAADGGTAEGPSYWNLQTVPVAGLMSTWRQVFGTGGPVALPDMTKTANFAYQLPGELTGGAPIVPTYSDAKNQGKKLRSTLPAWVASINPTPEAVALAKQANTSIGIQLIWWPTANPAAPDLTSRLFPSSGIGVLRSPSSTAWVTGGVRLDIHKHLQAGGVSLIGDGVQWGVDPGGGDYRQAGYFDVTPEGRRWRYFHPGVTAHSTLHTAVTATNPGQIVSTLAPLTQDAGANSITVPLKPVLQGVGSASRTVVLDPSGVLTITDSLGATPALTWQWVTGATATVTGANTVLLSRDGQQRTITFTGLPAGATVSTQATGFVDDLQSPITVVKVSLPRIAGSATVVASIQ